jgi:hypothetical protein
MHLHFKIEYFSFKVVPKQQSDSNWNYSRRFWSRSTHFRSGSDSILESKQYFAKR